MNMLKRFILGATAASLSLGMMVAINAQDDTLTITGTQQSDDPTIYNCSSHENCDGLHVETQQGLGAFDTTTEAEVANDPSINNCPNHENCDGLHDGTHQRQENCITNDEQNKHGNGHHLGRGNQN